MDGKSGQHEQEEEEEVKVRGHELFEEYMYEHVARESRTVDYVWMEAE